MKTLFILFLSFFFFCGGCGVMVGTAVDSAIGIATYPFKEYIFWGSYKYDNTWDTKYTPLKQDKDYGEILLGMGVSGGGSRSAYFMACVMKELNQVSVEEGSNRTYLQELDYISSVSGGSLASAYYCLLGYQGQDGPDAKFLDQFQQDMKSNFQARAILEYLLFGGCFLDFFTYYDRGDLMADVWDKNFFRYATFQDLSEAEKKGAPILLINATSLNDGLKFVFSTLPDESFQNSEYFQCIKNACFMKQSATQEYKSFHTIGFQSLDIDIRPYRITKAVVASASVPNLLGPVTLKDQAKKEDIRLVNLVDGGVYDNYGLESLMQIFTAYLDKNPGKKAKILLIDGSGYFKEENRQNDEYTVADYSMRPLEVSWMRSKSYMEYVSEKAKNYQNEKGEYPYCNLDFEIISLYDILPSQESTKPWVNEIALQKILRPDITTQDFLEKVATIQTRFKLSCEDIQMIEDVAKKVVKTLIHSKRRNYERKTSRRKGNPERANDHTESD
ncbi:MAG: patatin-like phospholipase family protein [Candidatus Brocadiae bacterium]|nr:patatin-like phospholipase family protein [Candidatus Brocadiia bacterium]